MTKRAVPSRLTLVPSFLPAFALLLSLVGQVKEQVSAVAVVLAGFCVPWGLAVLLAAVVQLVRKQNVLFLVVALGLTSLVIGSAVVLVVQAPLWVQWRAAPALHAIDAERTSEGHYPSAGSLDGDFPNALRDTLVASGHCIYRPRGASFRLGCLSVPYMRCYYDGATARWSGCE